jgi:hypothetical protein
LRRHLLLGEVSAFDYPLVWGSTFLLTDDFTTGVIRTTPDGRVAVWSEVAVLVRPC